MNYEEYMQIAIDEANKGVEMGEQPYGAILVVDGAIASVAHNETLSSKDVLNHAEIVAINNYLNNNPKKAKDITLITTCEPCVKCFGAAIKLGVNRFVYGSDIETAISYGSNDIHLGINDFKASYKFETISGVLKNECDKLLEMFYLKNHIVTYSKGNNEEIFWMKKALEVGKKGMLEKDELPIGVLLVAGNKLLAETCTLTYTLNSPITHGDFMALFNAKREVYSPNIERPLVLYSTLEPHLLGFGAAIKCKVDKVVFGLEAIPDGGSCYLKSMVGVKEKIPKVVGGILRDEQYKLMKEFLETHEEKRVGYSYAKSLVKLYEEENTMDFDYFYSKQKSYFGEAPSDGLVEMLKEYKVKPGKALDLGAGEGRNSIYLAELGFEVTSIEPTKDGSNKIIEKANQLGLNINVLNCDYLSEDSKEKYDFIIAGTSLDHMEKDYLDKAIKKLKRSLNKGGLVYIVVFTEEDPGYLKQTETASECSDFIKHYFAKNELKNDFKGFDILYYKEYTKPDNSHGKPHIHGKAKLIARKK